MGKLSYEDKIDLYNDWQAGMSIVNLSRKYNINKSGVVYLTKLKGLSPVNYRLQSSN